MASTEKTVSTKPKAQRPEPSGYELVQAGQKALVNRWLETAEKGNPRALTIILEGQGHTVRFTEGRIRVFGFPDPITGAKVITATGAPPVYIRPTDFFPQQPSRLMSEASDYTAAPSELLRRSFENYGDLEKFLATHFAGFRPHMKDFFAARAEGKTALESITEDAIAKVMPAEHDGTIEVCRVAAIDKAAAQIQLRSGSVPFKRVRISATGQVLEPLGWHGQRPTRQEEFAYDRAQAVENRRRRQQIEAEVRQYRSERLSEAGLAGQ